MFIKYEDIKDEILIDVRTKKEFELASVAKHNIAIIEEKEYAKIKKFYPCAFIVITLGLLKRRKFIKKQLIDISENKKKPLIIGCSRARMRSPMIYFYCLLLGIKAKVLYKGIKVRLTKEQQENSSWFL